MGVEEPLRVRCQSDQHPTAAGPSIIRSLGGRSYLERGRVGF
jgi:hypothetical protein